MQRNPWIFVLGALVAGAACSHHTATAGTGGTVRDDRPVQLHVINHYTLPVIVYAAGSNTSYRMGTVLPGMSGTFELRQSMVGSGPVEFVVQPASTEAPARSGRLLLGPGDVVDFEIATRVLHSVATVRP